MVNLTGDVTEPQTSNPWIIPHIVNTDGLWGSGVVIPIGNKWPGVRSKYLKRFQYCNRLGLSIPLGETQIVPVTSGNFVANMVAQKFHWNFGQPPIRHDCLRECMLFVGDFAKKNRLEIHAPWFGTMRAGSTKEVISDMIEEIWHDIPVFMYEYNG